MAKKTPKQLEDDIDAYLRYEKIGPRQAAPAPKWDPKLSAWVGGDKATLYAWHFRDGYSKTDHVIVKPGTGRAGKAGIVSGPGPGVGLPRIATLAEAEEHWQTPLHRGWNVKP